ncbi:MAG: 50S ribosomal protein L5 [Clostridiales bacterium]|nr:50S ribosomal protein L5 [Clostridiales bacterium]
MATKKTAAENAEVKEETTKKAAAPKTAKKASAAEKKYVSRVQEQYEKEVVPALTAKFGYKNVMQVPKLVKIVVSSGLGDIKDNAKSIQMAQSEMKLITGQQPVTCKAKKSVANFKVREGMVIGLKVTLRGKMMYDFFDKFISIALPRVRDFRGVSAESFDGKGNYCTGVKEQLMFPEIQYDQVEKIRGMDICFVTTAKSDEEARELLRAMGMPFKK